MPTKLEKVLKRLEFEQRDSSKETMGTYVFLNPQARVGRFCYDADECPEPPIAIIRKRRGRGTRAILVVTKSKTWIRRGGMVEEDRELLKEAGCRFVDHKSVDQRFEDAA